MSNLLCQACGNPDNHHEGGGPTCIQKCERNRLDLEAAKQREAESLKTMQAYYVQVDQLKQERDAALSAWQLLHDYAKGEVKDWEGRNADRFWQSNRFLQTMENWLATSTAALAERDRAIERNAAIRCMDKVLQKMGRREREYLTTQLVLQALLNELRREFNLEPKPKPSGLCSAHRD